MKRYEFTVTTREISTLYTIIASRWCDVHAIAGYCERRGEE